MNGDTHELWKDGKMLAWIREEPKYQNRGRWMAMIEDAGVQISDKDPWPRYYFMIASFIMMEVEQWLEAHQVKLEGREWRLKEYGKAHGIDLDAIIAEHEAQARAGDLQIVIVGDPPAGDRLGENRV